MKDADGSGKCFLNVTRKQFNGHTFALVPLRGVFDQQFDPLVFENFSKFANKRAKMTVKE